jgi:predicted CXXCH cytochrome family protein
VHANVRDREPIGCTACHGVHDVASRQQLRTASGIDRANARCSSCHQSQVLPASDAHAGRALCAACHGAHDVQEPELAASLAHPLNQLATCGACHDSIAAIWRTDVHADTLRQLRAAGVLDDDPETLPACTACHGSHGMIRPNAEGFRGDEVERCQRCHQDRTRTFFKSYHGKATVLGSEVAASCAQCHGGHGIRPSSEPASRLNPARLVETCGACHENARPAFVKYDSHPDPLNLSRNAWISLSFYFMNGLLIFVIIVFGAHTLLWWIRLAIDRRRGVDHDHGNDRGEGGAA